jgi:hypothetical protein
VPKRSAIVTVPMPSALRRIILARSTTFCGVLRLRTNRSSSSLLSSGRSILLLVLMRGPADEVKEERKLAEARRDEHYDDCDAGALRITCPRRRRADEPHSVRVLCRGKDSGQCLIRLGVTKAMRKLVLSAIVAAAIGLSTAGGVASADKGGVPNDNACRGQVTSSIASTWPWPRTHFAFPPPPGSIALYVDIFFGGNRDAFRAFLGAICGP